MKHLLLISGIAVLSGCAQIPNVKHTYFGTKTSVLIKTTQTFTCGKNSAPETQTNSTLSSSTPVSNTPSSESQTNGTSSQNAKPDENTSAKPEYFLHVTSSMVPTIVYSADYSNTFEYDYSTTNGVFSDGSVDLIFYDDGRLKSVNASTDGNGKEIISTLISAYTGAGKAYNVAENDIGSLCESTIGIAGDKKALTVSGFYEISGDKWNQTTAEKIALEPVITSKNTLLLTDMIEGKMIPTVEVMPVSDNKALEADTPCSDGKCNVNQLIAVQIPKEYTVSVNWKNPLGDIYAKESFSVLIPEKGVVRHLAMPEPSLFGKIDMELTLAESGMITKLKYGTTDGASGSDSINSLIETVSSSTSEKAAALQAEADLIKQQQRLIKCKADPENCE